MPADRNTLDNFRVMVAQAKNENPDWRIGQAAFNVLNLYRPDLAAQVRGKPKLDPFHAFKVDDRRFVAFVQFLEENW